MDNNRDEGSVNKPLLLDETNYYYWKAKMVAFIKSIGSKTLKVVVKGWKHPKTTSEDGSTSLKLEVG